MNMRQVAAAMLLLGGLTACVAPPGAMVGTPPQCGAPACGTIPVPVSVQPVLHVMAPAVNYTCIAPCVQPVQPQAMVYQAPPNPRYDMRGYAPVRPARNVVQRSTARAGCVSQVRCRIETTCAEPCPQGAASGATTTASGRPIYGKEVLSVHKEKHRCQDTVNGRLVWGWCLD